MKSRKALRRAFGAAEGFPEVPTKIGNVAISRLVNCRAAGGCSFCYPHGFETTNSRRVKNTRSWKHNRATQYRVRG